MYENDSNLAKYTQININIYTSPDYIQEELSVIIMILAKGEERVPYATSWPLLYKKQNFESYNWAYALPQDADMITEAGVLLKGIIICLCSIISELKNFAKLTVKHLFWSLFFF